MAVDWVLRLACRPKQVLGDGDAARGTDELLAGIKARNRAAAIADIAERDGRPPAGMAVVVRVTTADGGVEDREVRYDDLVAQAARLDPLAADCHGCPGNVRGRSFGCVGAVNYPIRAAVEEWLAGRLRPAAEVGGKLFLAAIRDFRYTGEPLREFRDAGLFEAPGPVRKTLAGGLFSSHQVTTDQLFQAVFCVPEPLDPGHCLGVLLWLGGVELDGRPVDTPEQVTALVRLATADERRGRTTLVTGADEAVGAWRRRLAPVVGEPGEDDDTVAGMRAFDRFLCALYHSWVADTPLSVSA